MIVFVAGIHGVGKTFLGAPVAERLGIQHATASQLIREERGSQPWTNNKRVTCVDDNQAALISAVNKLKLSGGTLILDGHFVLRGEGGAFIEISDTVFRDLRIDAILLLQSDAEVILERLQRRGDKSWAVPELKALAMREVERARKIASTLSISLRLLDSPDEALFQDAVQSALSAKFSRSDGGDA